MTRILPDLQCSLLCEQIRREASGNFFIIGIIDGIATPTPFGFGGWLAMTKGDGGMDVDDG